MGEFAALWNHGWQPQGITGRIFSAETKSGLGPVSQSYSNCKGNHQLCSVYLMIPLVGLKVDPCNLMTCRYGQRNHTCASEYMCTLECPISSCYGPGSVAGHVPTLPWVRSRFWVRVGLGSGLATGKGWVGTWPVTRLDPLLLFFFFTHRKQLPLQHRLMCITSPSQSSWPPSRSSRALR